MAASTKQAGLVATGLTLVIAGCGGYSPSQPYSIASTEGCLWSAGAQLHLARSDVDRIARGASRGALHANVNVNELVISFGADEREARTLEERYDAKPRRLSELVREDNAVLAWTHKPDSADRDLVEGCLKP